MAIQHELSWSASRAGTFASCKRRYYYDYYLSWLGWSAQADPARRRTYLLKKMTRMPMLAGDLVHQAIERWIKGRARGQDLRLEDLQTFTTQKLREGYKSSRDGTWKQQPSKRVHLAEHHYEEGDVDESGGKAGAYGKRYLERMNECLSTFMASPELAAARQAPPEGHLGCEDMSTFVLFDTKVFAVPDFAYRDGDGVVHVYDWKTGRPNERDKFQLSVYVEYAAATWDADPEKVVCYDMYLGQDELVAMEPDPQARDAVRKRMQESMQEMAAVHFDADRGVGNPADFPMIEPGRTCASCNYRELCDRQ